MTTEQAISLSNSDKLYINGQWVNPVKGGMLEIVSPHLEQVTATVAEATEADMDAAVDAARSAFDEGEWPGLSPAVRADYLRKLHTELTARMNDLAQALPLQVGALAMTGPMMTGLGLHLLDYYASGAEGFKFIEEATSADGQGAAIVVHEPVGVVAIIVPWNAPFSIMMNKISPALLAGCTVIMKPAPETPIEAHILAEAAEAAGFPAGVINVVAAHREASDHLVCNEGVDKVSFTGSTVAGKRIASVCGARIARCALELGGKSAAIILDDYDVVEAAKTLAMVISIATGQVCVTLSRVIISRDRHDAFVDALKEAMEAIKVGDPNDPESQMGPLAMARQLDRVEACIAKGIEEGATLVCGGDRPAHLSCGYYINPTVFANVSPDMSIAQDEIFGPVIAVIPCDDEDEAVRIANNSQYGLFGAVMTNDNDKAYKIARSIRTGAYTQNSFRLDYFLPFGGFKQSGIGREGGISGLKSFTETKTILLDGLPAKL